MRRVNGESDSVWTEQACYDGVEITRRELMRLAVTYAGMNLHICPGRIVDKVTLYQPCV